MKRVMFLYGTRPEAVKMAPIIHAVANSPGIEPVVCVTGQHREMLDQVNSLFGIVPDHDLDIIRPGQSLDYVTSTVLQGATRVIQDSEPDLVVVQGDTTTTMASALAAFYCQKPIVHVEAGLRTDDRYSPFPEEINRRLTSSLAELHLAPSQGNADNLMREGILRDAICITGNTVIDALHMALSTEAATSDARIERLLADPRRLLLVTAHRRENWGSPMRSVARAVRRLAAREDVTILLPMHRNPLVRQELVPELGDLENVLLTEPLEYYDFARCMAHATLILSDSGGVQEEAPALGVPVLVLRENTERPEAVLAGTARLVGCHEDRIYQDAQLLLDNVDAYEAMSTAINPYGDGHAAARSVQAMRSILMGEGRPQEFQPDG